ncbi:MAG: hypothetical protein KF760_08155 [Candidatus Eremiobacteraeota bacterium]|nr:hypothetical protein [Candidatus Eremiobacteraeota bacterium]MCW5867959.1 hypothetical protein [Candidatus Eremiobacteraeota bacterium]
MDSLQGGLRRFTPPPMPADATYVASPESRLAARQRGATDGLKELAQGLKEVGEWATDELDGVSHGLQRSGLPGAAAAPMVTFTGRALNGVTRSVGGTLEAVACLPELVVATVKDPKKVAKSLVESVPHLLDDYKQTADQRGWVAGGAQFVTDMFGFGWAKKAIGLGKPVVKQMTRQVVKQEVKAVARQQVKSLSRKEAVAVIRRELPQVTRKELQKMPAKQQRKLTEKAVRTGAVRELKHMEKPNVARAVQHTITPPAPWLHPVQHSVHHALHWFGEESVKHLARGVAQPGKGH